jgi:hypothetical protein
LIFDLIFIVDLSHMLLLTPIRVSAMVPNPVPTADSFAIAGRSWLS